MDRQKERVETLPLDSVTRDRFTRSRFMEFTEPLTAVIPPPGIVLLNDKQTPICERHNVKDLINNHGDSEFMAYTRGVVDVSEFKLYLRSLPPSIWDDEHQDGNVKVT